MNPETQSRPTLQTLPQPTETASPTPQRRSRIVLAGGSGFLGQRLASWFSARGRDVVVLTRDQPDEIGAPERAPIRQIHWDGRTVDAWARELDGAEALINLAGKSVDCRYHARNRRLILNSRTESTRVLGEAIGRCAKPPRVWLNASTATIYRHTFGAPWDEHGAISGTAEAKDLFSVQVAEAWEEALATAPTPGTRKVAMRLAMVLGEGRNSVFPVLRRLVRSGLGGRMGSGRQYVSWIHETDACRAIEWLLENESMAGPVNLAAPGPVPNAELMRTLRDLCGVRFGLPASAWMLELGAFFLRTETELIIKSRRVVPGRLQAAGFTFVHPTLQEALKDLCDKAA